MDVTLPNGVTIRGVPDNATKDQIKAKAIAGGLAQESDFGASTAKPVDEAPKEDKSSSFSDVANEAMAAINRGAVNTVDVLGMPIREPVNALLSATGSDYRIPTLRQSLSETPASVEGNYMQDGLGKRIVRAAGELALPSAATGGAIRQTAAALSPAMTAANANLALPNIGRLMQQGTSASDLVMGAASGVGSSVGKEYGGDIGEMVGGILAPFAMAAPSATGNAIKSLFAENPSQIAKTIDDFSIIGQIPSAGLATGSKALQRAETVSGSVMGGAPIRNKADAIAEGIQKKIASMADTLSSKVGAESAGLEIKKGIQGKDGFLDRFRTTSGALWQNVDNSIDPSINVSSSNTKSALDRLVRGDKIGEVLDNPKLIQLKDVLANAGQIDYGTLKSLRTSIGQKLGNNELISDIPRAELKQVYGALTEDIKVAASNSSPQALKAFERANSFTRAGHDRVDDYLERIVNKADPDKIYAAVAKGGEGTKTINAVKRSLNPDEWDVVASNVIRRMGRASSGMQNAEGDVFSVDKFVTDWDKLGPAKKAIFSGSEKLNAMADDLEKIARVSSRVKSASKQGANYSGTAQAASQIAAGTGLATGILSASPTVLGLTVGSIAMNSAGSRLMTNPKFVKWLATSAAVPAKNASSSISALLSVANNSSADDAAAIEQLARELENKK